MKKKKYKPVFVDTGQKVVRGGGAEPFLIIVLWIVVIFILRFMEYI